MSRKEGGQLDTALEAKTHTGAQFRRKTTRGLARDQKNLDFLIERFGGSDFRVDPSELNLFERVHA
jgi:hypothetical protein